MFYRHHFPFERRSRMFEKGELKYVILGLLKDKPAHGYEIMRALEDSFHGFYTPSAGSVYPTLQMLEDMGYVRSSERDGKKVYTITPEGEQFLKEHQETIDKIKDQMRDWQRPRDFEGFRETVHDLRAIGGLVARRARDLTMEDWGRIKEVVGRTRHDIEEILGTDQE
jgi:DNA-binding PadR family transcriptional regulator